MGRHEALMEREIEKRMVSDLWDRGVARSVVRRYRRKRFAAASGALASMAAAAMLVAALLPGLRDGGREGEALYGIVTAQVDGTWNRVFDGDAAGPTAFSPGEPFDNGLESLIGEALSSRL